MGLSFSLDLLDYPPLLAFSKLILGWFGCCLYLPPPGGPPGFPPPKPLPNPDGGFWILLNPNP